MKNVDVVERLIDIMKEWQKLKKMTSMLLLHLNSPRLLMARTT